MSQLFHVPKDLPVPVDDGATDHLLGHTIPGPISLPSTSNTSVDLAAQSGLTILFCYPRTAPPDEAIPDEWNSIPGARGCTPQACSFRDSIDDLRAHGATHVFGCSTQDTAFQTEVHTRLHLPYDLLSDEKLEFARALKMPTFEYEGATLLKRVTLAFRKGKIVKVWYPVFPTHESASEVLKWLKEQLQPEQ